MLHNEVYVEGVNLLSQGLHGCILYMLFLFPDPVRFIRDQDGQNHLDQDQHMLQKHTQLNKKNNNTYAVIQLVSLTNDLFISFLRTSTKTANSRKFVLLIPPSWHSSRNRGDSISSQQLDTTETKLRTSKANWNTRQWHKLFSHNWWVVTHCVCLISVVHCVSCWPATRPCQPQGEKMACGKACRSCRHPIGSL